MERGEKEKSLGFPGPRIKEKKVYEVWGGGLGSGGVKTG